MTNYAFTHDVGSLLKAVEGQAPTTIAASTAASVQSGTIFDRFATPSTADAQERVNSAKVISQVRYSHSTATTALTVTCRLLHSASTVSSAFTALEQKNGTTAYTLSAPSGATGSDLASGNYDLAIAGRYVRTQMSIPARAAASSVSTINLGAVLVFGGSNQNPPSS